MGGSGEKGGSGSGAGGVDGGNCVGKEKAKHVRGREAAGHSCEVA